VLLAILVSETAFDLPFLQPGNNSEIVVFAALSALIFLLFVAEALCRAQAGRLGVEVPHTHGGRRVTALVCARDGDVLVRLRPDEPLD
jgi:hypothetical protein